MNKVIKGSITTALIISGIAVVVGFVVRFQAGRNGADLGASLGTNSGKLVGSIEGFSEAAAAYDAGKKIGLSAEDTESRVANTLSRVEKLEVLVASVKLSDCHKVGTAGDETYAALYLISGEVVVTVDLGKSKVDDSGENLVIILPEPEAELRLDQEKIERKASYIRTVFNGSAEDGYDAYLNSMAALSEKSTEELQNYESIIASAKAAAEKQVKELVGATTINEKNVVILFENIEEEN